MSAIEAKRDLLEYIRGVVEDDDAMKGFLGDPLKMYYGAAPPEEKPPYVCHDLSLAPDEECWGILQGAWSVAVWSYGKNASDALAICNRLHELFERRFYKEPAGLSFSDSRIWYLGDVDSPQDETGRIWTYGLRFMVRVVARSAIQTITER